MGWDQNPSRRWKWNGTLTFLLCFPFRLFRFYIGKESFGRLYKWRWNPGSKIEYLEREGKGKLDHLLCFYPQKSILERSLVGFASLLEDQTCKWWQVQVWISKLEWKGRVQPSALFLRPRLPSLSIWSQPATPKPPAIHCYQEQTLLPSLSSIIISFLVALTWHMSGYIHCLTPPILKRILVQNTNFC